MKAIVLDRYCQPEELKLKEVPVPVPKENEVLIKVHASAVNDYDWELVRGKLKFLFGFSKPRIKIPGAEVAGTIVEIGAKVKKLKIGDDVYGDISESGFGGFSEYVSINENALSLKPEKMTFEEAAAIPHATMLAVQGLIDIGKIQNGQKILINGAGGGVGTYALQLAKLYNAKVTGVDTGDKLQTMKSIGFDHIIDYQKEDFTKNNQHYDLILDCKTTRSPFSYVRSLAPKGIYATVGGRIPRLLQALLFSPIIYLFSKKKIRIVALKPNKDLDYINELYEAGKIKPVLDTPYKLSEVGKAIRYFGEGKHTGKVVITI